MRLFWAFLLCFLVVPNACAASGCPEMPATVIQEDAVKGNAEAGFLTRLISKFEIGGQYTKKVGDLFNKDGAIERAKMINLAFQCAQIYEQFPNDPARRRVEFQRVFEYLFGGNLKSPQSTQGVSENKPKPRPSGNNFNARSPATLPRLVDRPVELVVKNSETIHRDIENTECGNSYPHKILISSGMSNFDQQGYIHLRKNLGCDYKLTVDLGSRQDGRPLNAIVMKGSVTYRTQVSIIRSLIRQGVYIKAVCASNLATQPVNTVLLTHASLNAETSAVIPLSVKNVQQLAATENSLEFNKFLSGQRRCSVP